MNNTVDDLCYWTITAMITPDSRKMVHAETLYIPVLFTSYTNGVPVSDDYKVTKISLYIPGILWSKRWKLILKSKKSKIPLSEQ